MPPPMLADTTYLYSLALGLVIAGVIIFFWSFRPTLSQPLARIFGRGTPPGRRTPELDHVMEDAQELAELIADRLDRQAARLEQLIAAADDRLTRLERAASQPLHVQPPPPPRQTADPLSLEVYTLSDRGLPPIEIARQLNQHTGKVELILALRQR